MLFEKSSSSAVLALVGSLAGIGAGCGEEDPPPSIAVVVEPASERFVRETLAFVTGASLPIAVVADPGAVADTAGAVRLAVVIDRDVCAECYRVERAAHGLVVYGGLPLGVQYGVTEASELFGFRFFTPTYTVAPREAALPPAEHSAFSIAHKLEIARRGLHLHTFRVQTSSARCLASSPSLASFPTYRKAT